MNIAVTAASGALGGAIIKELIKKVGAERVIAIARNPQRVQDLKIEIRQGDYNKPTQFDAALKDIDALLLVSGTDYPENRKVQHANVIESAKNAGVTKLIYVSILGPETNSQFSPIVESNRYTEEYLKDSGLEWSIGRNGIYIEPDIACIEEYKKLGEIINCAETGRCAYTTRAELAIAYTSMLTEDHHSQLYNLNGEPITQIQLADLINHTFGTHLTYRAISVEEYEREQVEALGELGGKIVSGIYKGIRDGAFDVQSDFEKATGRAHISWDEYFKNNAIEQMQDSF